MEKKKNNPQWERVWILRVRRKWYHLFKCGWKKYKDIWGKLWFFKIDN